MIAAAFYPKPVVVRMSDFKSNEYASLLGGNAFEAKEENPMIGFRGASRYTHPAYQEGFELECAAMKRVRDERPFRFAPSTAIFRNAFTPGSRSSKSNATI
jgi:pyruvate,water dikinase